MKSLIDENDTPVIETMHKQLLLVNELLSPLVNDIKVVIKQLIFHDWEQFWDLTDYNIDDLFSVIHCRTSLNSVIYDDIYYHERSHHGKDRSDLYADWEDDSYDSDFICTSDKLQHCHNEPDIFINDPNEQKYSIFYHYKELEQMKTSRRWKNPTRVLLTYNRSNIRIVHKKPRLDITCVNHCKVQLWQHVEQTIKFPLTLHEFAIHVTRLKIDKFYKQCIPPRLSRVNHIPGCFTVTYYEY